MEAAPTRGLPPRRPLLWTPAHRRHPRPWYHLPPPLNSGTMRPGQVRLAPSPTNSAVVHVCRMGIRPSLECIISPRLSPLGLLSSPTACHDGAGTGVEASAGAGTGTSAGAGAGAGVGEGAGATAASTAPLTAEEVALAARTSRRRAVRAFSPADVDQTQPALAIPDPETAAPASSGEPSVSSAPKFCVRCAVCGVLVVPLVVTQQSAPCRQRVM